MIKGPPEDRKYRKQAPMYYNFGIVWAFGFLARKSFAGFFSTAFNSRGLFFLSLGERENGEAHFAFIARHELLDDLAGVLS